MAVTEHTTSPVGVFPLPGGAGGTSAGTSASRAAAVAVPAPGPGPQRWAGAPAVALDDDGSIVLAYRLRDGADVNVIARSDDGERFTTVLSLPADRFGAAMVERPALVRTARGWRLYASCATPNSKHWWIGAAESAELAGLADAPVRRVFAGDGDTAVKDPVIRRDDDGRWEAWICCHLLDRPGHEDRMVTAYATSGDGLRWDWRGPVLAGRPGAWDARGTRVTSVLPDGRVSYDGRATAEENWFERTGLAAPAGTAAPGGRPLLGAVEDSPVVDVRYLTVLPLPTGRTRIYYEARLPDESHELRTELL